MSPIFLSSLSIPLASLFILAGFILTGVSETQNGIIARRSMITVGLLLTLIGSIWLGIAIESSTIAPLIH